MSDLKFKSLKDTSFVNFTYFFGFIVCANKKFIMGVIMSILLSAWLFSSIIELFRTKFEMTVPYDPGSINFILKYIFSFLVSSTAPCCYEVLSFYWLRVRLLPSSSCFLSAMPFFRWFARKRHIVHQLLALLRHLLHNSDFEAPSFPERVWLLTISIRNS